MPNQDMYRIYSRACIASGVKPLPRQDWAQMGEPEAPTGNEQAMS